MPGYDTEILVAEIDDKFICRCCKLLLRDAVQTLCGHRYCTSCIQQIASQPGVSLCVDCGEENGNDSDSLITSENVFPDNAIKREIKVLKVMCINDGCDWTGIFKDYEDHSHQCDFEQIACFRQGCGEKILRSLLADHLEQNCIMRVIECTYCDEGVIWSHLKSHHTECPKYLIRCEFCKKAEIARDEYRQHTDPGTGDCEKKVCPCTYRQLGCSKLVEGDNMQQHLHGDLVGHVDLVRDKVVYMSNRLESLNRCDLQAILQGTRDNTEKIVAIERDLERNERMISESKFRAEEEQEVRKLRGVVDKQSQKMSILETKTSTNEGIVAVLNREIEKVENIIKPMESERKKDRDLIEALQRKVKAQDRIIALKDVALAEQDLRIQSLEMASYDGVLLWKIDDFNRKRNDAIAGRILSIYSPCFFTARYGYKMCARIYLNGDGMGKGNHISLFVSIMKGKFDGLLRWPFPHKMILTILEQNNKGHINDSFFPDPASSSFKRPTTDMNIASGAPLFAPFSEVDNARNAYVKDDCMFVKVEVGDWK